VNLASKTFEMKEKTPYDEREEADLID